MTVLFVDVVESTTLGEQLDPEHFREVMETYFRAMRAEIEAEGGTVEKFIGDAIVGVFGVPLAHEDDSARALRAALRMSARLEELNRGLLEARGPRLAMRMGVNTGEVVAVRDSLPHEGMVIGDAVNVAARLEQNAKPGQVLVSGRTARSARGFELRHVGALSLKGKARAIPAFELIATADEPTRGVPGLSAPMVGREQELGLLQTFYRRATTEGRPALVTIYGEAGVGKTRLVMEFEEWARSSAAATVVVTGRCLPYGEGITYWPLAEILKQDAGVLDTDAPEAALAKIRNAVAGKLAPPIHGSMGVPAALALSVGLHDPQDPPSELEPRRLRMETHAAWRTYFTTLAAAGPAVVVVEDIHWADSALLDLLEELANRVSGPILFLCPSRLELLERRPGWGGGQRSFSGVYLEPLPPQAAERLVDHLLSSEDLPPELRSRILQRAEGNPFFLEEIVRQLVDEHAIERVEGRWRAVNRGATVEIPDTVQAVLAARIDLLQPGDRKALQAASVVGRVFWTGPVERLLDGEARGLDETLARLEDRELVRASPRSSMAGAREYVFKHILTRDVAYGTLTRRDRARAHGSVASWIEETAGERRREFAELLAHHFTEAHRGARNERVVDQEELETIRLKALRYLLLAAEETRKKLVLDRSKAFAERALAFTSDEAERSLALGALGEAYLYDYWGDRAWEYLCQAVDAALAGAPDDHLRIARLCGLALESPTRWGAMRSFPEAADAGRYLAIGLEHAGDADTEERARLLVAKAMWPAAFPSLRGEAELLSGREASKEAAALAERLGRSDLLSAALDGLGYSFLTMGLAGRVGEVTGRRLALVPALIDPREIEDAYAMAAWAAFHTGRYAEAAGLATEGFNRSVTVTAAMGLHCLEWRALAKFRLGDWDGFFEDFELGRRLVGEREESPPGFISRPFAVAALISEVRGDGGEADRLMKRLTALEGEWQEVGTCDAWLGSLLARRGRFAEARARLVREEFAYIRENLGLLLEARCDLLIEEEAWDEARETVEEARAHAEAAALIALRHHADRLEAMAAEAAGDRLRALDLLGAAREGFDAIEARWEAARTDLLMAEVLFRGGRTEEARRSAAPSVPVFEELGARRELDRARSVAEA